MELTEIFLCVINVSSVEIPRSEQTLWSHYISPGKDTKLGDWGINEQESNEPIRSIVLCSSSYLVVRCGIVLANKAASFVVARVSFV